MYSASSVSFTLAVRSASVECWRTAGTTSSFKYLMNSGISFSIRSAASATVLLTRADASSTLRLKSFIMLLADAGRETPHAIVADVKPSYYFLVGSAGQCREDVGGMKRLRRQHALDDRRPVLGGIRKALAQALAVRNNP